MENDDNGVFITFHAFSMSQQPADDPNVIFEGVSSIALRFSEKDQYEEAVKLYSSALPHGRPKNQADVSKLPSCSLIISKKSELLLMLKEESVTDCTIVYWKVDASQPFEDTCRALEEQGYKLVENPKNSPPGSRDKEKTIRAVFEDKSGHRAGVIINPPVPFVPDPKPRQSEMEFPVEPTHIVNPPATVGGEGKVE